MKAKSWRQIATCVFNVSLLQRVCFFKGNNLDLRTNVISFENTTACSKRVSQLVFMIMDHSWFLTLTVKKLFKTALLKAELPHTIYSCITHPFVGKHPKVRCTALYCYNLYENFSIKNDNLIQQGLFVLYTALFISLYQWLSTFLFFGTLTDPKCFTVT